MLTDERLKQLMKQVGMPNSASLYKALRQCDMEATLAERERSATLITSGNYCRYVDHNNGTCDCADMAAGLRAV